MSRCGRGQSCAHTAAACKCSPSPATSRPKAQIVLLGQWCDVQPLMYKIRGRGQIWMFMRELAVCPSDSENRQDFTPESCADCRRPRKGNSTTNQNTVEDISGQWSQATAQAKKSRCTAENPFVGKTRAAPAARKSRSTAVIIISIIILCELIILYFIITCVKRLGLLSWPRYPAAGVGVFDFCFCGRAGVVVKKIKLLTTTKLKCKVHSGKQGRCVREISPDPRIRILT